MLNFVEVIPVTVQLMFALTVAVKALNLCVKHCCTMDMVAADTEQLIVMADVENSLVTVCAMVAGMSVASARTDHLEVAVVELLFAEDTVRRTRCNFAGIDIVVVVDSSYAWVEQELGIVVVGVAAVGHSSTALASPTGQSGTCRHSFLLPNFWLRPSSCPASGISKK